MGTDQCESLVRGAVSEPSQRGCRELAIAALARGKVVGTKRMNFSDSHRDRAIRSATLASQQDCAVLVAIGPQEVSAQPRVVGGTDAKLIHVARSQDNVSIAQPTAVSCAGSQPLW